MPRESTAPASPREPRDRGPAGPPSAPRPIDPGTSDDDTDYLFDAHPGASIDTAYVIGRALELIGARPKQVLLIALASGVVGWLLVLAMALLGAVGNPLWEAAGIGDLMHPAAVLVVLLLGWAAALLLGAPLLGSAIEVHTDGRGLFGVLWRRAVSSLPRLLGASLVVELIVLLVLTVSIGLQAGIVVLGSKIPWPFVGLLFDVMLTVTMVYFALKVIAGLCLVVPVILVEDLGVGDALRRAWALGWRNGLAIVWAMLLPSLIAQGVLFVASFLPVSVFIGVGIVLGLALALYQTALVPVAYVAIREYVEGLHPGRLLVARAKPRGAPPPRGAARPAKKAPAGRPARRSPARG